MLNEPNRRFLILFCKLYQYTAALSWKFSSVFDAVYENFYQFIKRYLSKEKIPLKAIWALYAACFTKQLEREPVGRNPTSIRTAKSKYEQHIWNTILYHFRSAKAFAVLCRGGHWPPASFCKMFGRYFINLRHMEKVIAKKSPATQRSPPSISCGSATKKPLRDLACRQWR